MRIGEFGGADVEDSIVVEMKPDINFVSLFVEGDRVGGVLSMLCWMFIAQR